MSTSDIHAYERDPYARELEVDVLSLATDDEGRGFALLSDTVLYPEGGGQPADHGQLDGHAVVDVQRCDGEIRHYLRSELAPGSIGGPHRLELDWERRFDHMQQHTAQHLLTAVAEQRFGWQTTSFHLRERESDIELSTFDIGHEQLLELENAVAEVIRAAVPVRATRLTAEQYAGQQVRSRGLPADHRGDVRLIEIEGVDATTCGGTHVHSTAEVEALHLLRTEKVRGSMRLHWIAGGRVRARLRADQALLGELRQLLETGDEELIQVAQLKLERLKSAQRSQRVWAARFAEAAAEVLSVRTERFIDAHYEDADGGFLRGIAQRLESDGHSQLALLTASHDKGNAFVLVASEAVDLQRAGAITAELLQGRGGGSGRIFQGRAETLDRRPELVKRLRPLAEVGA